MIKASRTYYCRKCGKEIPYAQRSVMTAKFRCEAVEDREMAVGSEKELEEKFGSERFAVVGERTFTEEYSLCQSCTDEVVKLITGRRLPKRLAM